MKEIGVNIKTVVVLCVAIATGSWAVSTEAHNYRLQNITDRLQAHETSIMDLKLGFAEISRDISYIREGIDAMMQGH